MNNIEFIDIFKELWDHSENEVVEFKKAETNFDIDELGKYFSALSNEANLREHEFAWIVFGVWDKKHQIIGTSFKDGEVALNRLKQDMSQHTTDNLIFRDIIPSNPQPIGFSGILLAKRQNSFYCTYFLFSSLGHPNFKIGWPYRSNHKVYVVPHPFQVSSPRPAWIEHECS